MATVPASGIQHDLIHGDYRAQIASVGASVRSLTYAGRDLVVPFAADEVRPAYRGATLVPWPNRIVDGRYPFGGEEHQVALNEPGRGQALHGLGAWAHWAEVTDAAASVDTITLAMQLEPQSGYPWRLRIESTFVLGDEGLTQRVRATNLSETPAPFGTGPHPYLVAPGRLDDWTFHLPAERVLLTTPDRLSPTELVEVSVDAPRFDFRDAREIGGVEIDHSFTGLARDSAGVAEVRVVDAAGVGARMSFDGSCDWVQIHTADLPGGAENPRNRAGLAVEPMTCSPDAFNAARYGFDTGLLTIAPGTSVEASWTIAAVS